jgi:UDP:flavonoid glycosyltransferase YjiC (YdhE family)
LPAARPSALHVTDPWLVRCAGEIPDRGRVKELLRMEPNEERCILVCASGKEEELDWYGAVVSELIERSAVAVRCVAAERPPRCPEACWVRYWPAMDLFGCAAAVVGGAGYNTVEECVAWKVPLLARPWPRAYDRQELRAQRASVRGRVTVVKEVEEAARAAIAQVGEGPAGLPEFVNGAEEAVERIGGLTLRS